MQPFPFKSSNIVPCISLWTKLSVWLLKLHLRGRDLQHGRRHKTPDTEPKTVLGLAPRAFRNCSAQSADASTLLAAVAGVLVYRAVASCASVNVTLSSLPPPLCYIFKLSPIMIYPVILTQTPPRNLDPKVSSLLPDARFYLFLIRTKVRFLLKVVRNWTSSCGLIKPSGAEVLKPVFFRLCLPGPSLTFHPEFVNYFRARQSACASVTHKY